MFLSIRRSIVLFLLLTPCISNATPSSEPVNKSWSRIFDEAKESVVQVFSYTGKFDLFEPYRPPSHNLGAGTGFFINNDGYLITSAHVVTNALATFIQISKLGKERFFVDIVGIHPERDIALLKIQDGEHTRLKKALGVSKLPYLSIANNSDTLKEPDKIMLVGYPLGDENIKAAQGECAGREFFGRLGSMIQTTVPSNPGNSGGPYLNRNGEIVGICTFGVVGLGIEGVNYFATSNTLKMVLPDLYKQKITSNSFLGCSYIPTTQHTNNYLKCSAEGGIYLNEVQPGSLGDSYGLQKGDVVYQIDDLAIDHYGCVVPSEIGQSIELRDYFSRLPLGTPFTMTLSRNGESIELQLTTQEPQSFKVNPYYPLLQPALAYEVIGGLVMVELTTNHLEAMVKHTPSVEKYFKAKKRLKGHILASTVLPASPAQKTRCFTRGDWFIKQINGHDVETIQDVRDAIAQHTTADFITFETEEGSLAVLSIDEILAEEDSLAQQYGYQKSDLIPLLDAARKA